MRLRKNISTIENDPADKTLQWFGRAIGEMKSRPISSHRSLRYQAAVHEYRRELDPLADDADVLPSTSDQRKYWTQCQHHSWFFLPWHRMYLFHFESIVAAQVEALGGPKDWGLPYWDYHGDSDSRSIPPSFREPTHVGGETNHLFNANRRPGANSGAAVADDWEVDLSCLREAVFAAPPFAGSPGFGGPRAGSQHAGGSMGALESIPHGSMHMFVGGWMSNFTRTGLDPLFYCHHCNIDRLWEVWLRRDPNHANPTSPLWLRIIDFHFRDLHGNDEQMKCRDVLDTEQQLQYLYEDVSDPLMGEADHFGLGVAMASFPEMIGASDTLIQVGVASAVHTKIAVAKQVGEAFGLELHSQRIYLHLENLTCEGPAQAIDIFVGVPADSDPLTRPELRVARFPLFGIGEASRIDGPHAGSGLTFAIDITSLVRELPDIPGDLLEIPISLQAVGDWGAENVRVGRISLYAEEE